MARDDGAVRGHETTVRTAVEVDLRRTLASLRRGHRDPAYQVTTDGAVWRATALPSGPATLRLVQTGPCDVHVTAWGAGAAQALAGAPAMVGELDDLAGFDPPPGPVRDAYRSSSRVRLPRGGRVLEALVPAILEQRVITRTAYDAWQWLLTRHGTPAPGPAPAGMRVPPTAHTWASVPVWDFHRAGVDPRRARAVVAAARVAHRLEEAAAHGPAETTRRLLLVPGVGPWTAAETTQRALGDADAVSVGDFHLPGQVGWALARERVDDAGMLRLLEPYRPHRYRVVRHLLLAGLARAPRRGPRLAIEDHRGR